MKSSFFDFHGVSLFVSAFDQSSLGVLTWLNDDFEFFLKKDSIVESSQLEIKLYAKAPPPDVKSQNIFSFVWGKKRVCDYGNGTVVTAQNTKSKRVFLIYGNTHDELYEAAYTVLLSAVGEELDLKGFHRIHALGLSKPNVLVILPQGGGKSAMAALLLSSPLKYQFFSDETPLCRDGILFPFPSHLALRPQVAEALQLKNTNRLFQRRIFPPKSLMYFSREKIAHPGRINLVLVGKTGAGAPSINRSNLLTGFMALCKNMVVGLGVAQMREHMLRLNSIYRIVWIAFSRFIEMFRILKTSKIYVFEVSKDARVNTKVLTDFFKRLENLGECNNLYSDAN